MWYGLFIRKLCNTKIYLTKYFDVKYLQFAVSKHAWMAIYVHAYVLYALSYNYVYEYNHLLHNRTCTSSIGHTHSDN
jgi:hypothetical protein